jgi:acyl-CoA synthetase (AMP-forming)/AMP-acid ligase II
MAEIENRPWFIDGRTGATETYAELLADLNKNRVSVRPLCQPASPRDALRQIAASVAFGTELTLFDSGMKEHELEALGYRSDQINQFQTVSAGDTANLPMLKALAGGQSSARLGLFTSGSTGLPKLVWQTVANLARAVKVSPRHAGAVWSFAYNPTHVAGIQVYLQALANGCPVVDVFGLDRSGVLRAIEDYGVTHVSATPSFYRLLLPAERPLAVVRSVTLGGESSDTALLGRLRGLFPNARFHNVYASTEAGTLLSSEDDVFSIAPGLDEFVIVRDGRIHVHRSLLGVFAGAASADDWYDSGDGVDIVSSAPLRFRIVARERDWVNVGGNKVNPREVEAVLEEFPGVRKARVNARASSVTGHILCAEIECNGAAPTEPALREFAAARLQPFKVPRMIRFVANIMQTRSGKVSRQ